VLAILLAVPAGAHAEGVRLTLDEAVAKAKLHSARLAQLASLEDAAAAGLRGARAGRMPNVEVSAAYSRNSDVPELRLTLPGVGSRTLFPNIPDVYRTRAAASLPLYTGGRVAGAIAGASHLQDAAAKDAAAGESDLVLETTTAYWFLVTARESARVLTEAVAAYASHQKDAQSRLDVGMAARNELLAVQVERDRAELARLQAENSARVSNANLIRLTGLAADSDIVPLETTAPVAQVPGPSEALVAAALAARPELGALKARVAALEASIRVARAGSRPQAAASGGYDYANPNSRVLPLAADWKGTWSVGVSVWVSPFDGGRTSAAVAQATAQAEALRHQLEDAERLVALDVTSRLLDLGSAEAALAVTERNIEAARENVRVSRDRYQEGVTSSSDLLDAETALLRASLDRTGAVAQQRLAVARLERALGR
jgi:outer membrane protein TolC